MEFRILGRFEVWDEGREVSLGGSRVRFSPCSSSIPTRSFPPTG